MRTIFARVSILGSLLLAAACGAPKIVLPSGPGTPVSDYLTPLAAARSGCVGVRTFGAELSLSGRVGSQRLRGRVLAGFAPGALRLEAPTPSGGPALILVADGAKARLLLAREQRIVDNAAPDEILDALIGISLGAEDLRALLSGCLKSTVEATAARAYGTEWVVVDLQGGGAAYLRRRAAAGWQLTAGSYGGFDIQYGEPTSGAPAWVTIRRAAAGEKPAVDLTLRLSQVEVNGDLPGDRLVSLTVPAGTTPMTVDELRRSGLLGQ